MINFDLKYKQMHEELQENIELIKTLSDIALRQKAKNPNYLDKFYFSTGLKHNGIYLGLDFIFNHKMYFENIVAKMRLTHEISNGEADLCKIYCILEPSLFSDPFDRLAIISEDVTNNGKYRICSDSTNRGLSPITLLKVFKDTFGDISHIKFHIFDPLDPGNCAPPKGIRYPLVDFDHVAVRIKYQEQYEKYLKQYESDKRYRVVI